MISRASRWKLLDADGVVAGESFGVAQQHGGDRDVLHPIAGEVAHRYGQLIDGIVIDVGDDGLAVLDVPGIRCVDELVECFLLGWEVVVERREAQACCLCDVADGRTVESFVREGVSGRAEDIVAAVG